MSEAKKNASKYLFVGIITYSIIRFVLAFLQVVEEDKWVIFTDIEAIVVSLLAAIAIFASAMVFERSSNNFKIQILLSLGFFLYSLGEFFWGFYELILEIDPYPSIADLFYLIAYLPLIVGITWKSRLTLAKSEKRRLILSLVLTAAFAIVSLMTVIIPYLTDEESSIFERVIAAAYPILDIFVIAVVAILFSKYAGGKLERAWLILGVSMLITGVADTLFCYEDWNEIYNAYSFSHDLFIIGYLLGFAFGIYYRNTYK
ncbi:MAG: hypothetical protein INQ03_00365 [Candidatus Heimdallarchaeota archaeon]|nr:hypothetical protein [Candidatus Heimdallarchaeota archaeon]